MKNNYSILTILLFILFSLKINAQNNYGFISGKIIDSENGEPIIGANIIIQGTNLGTSSDLDGNFSIKNIPEGEYVLVISYISYITQKVEKVIVQNGKVTYLNISLKPSAIELGEEVVVISEKLNNYEAALLNQRKKSNQISDGISSEQIKKLTDNTTAETLRRLPGITLIDNKYIYIRGISERYNVALLNNSPLASSEPDKKDFAFDLIPSNLIENTIVIKSFTPDELGEFSGGLVKINTIEFPQKEQLSFSYSTSFVNNVSTKSFSTYEGSSTDFLGFDNGYRDLPKEFPDPLKYKLLDIQYTDTTRYYYSSLLNDKWGLKSSKAILDQSFGLTYANNFSVFDNDLGFVSALTYKISENVKDIITKDIEDRENNAFFFDYKGRKYNKNIYWGAIFNLSYKLGLKNKISLKNTFTTNTDDEVTRMRGFKYDYQDERIITALHFTQRNLYSTQLNGSNYLPLLNGLIINWRGSYSSSFRNEPDFRRSVYTRSILDSNSTVPFRAYIPRDPELYAGGRYYSYSREFKRGLGIDITNDLGFLKWKTGVFHSNSKRTFNARLLSVTSPSGVASQLIGNYELDSVYSAENFRKRIIVMREYYDPSNDYTSSDNLFAYYIMAEIPIGLLDYDISLITGARIENYVLRLRTTSSLATGLKPITVDKFNSDLLPALAFIIRLNDITNLRLSFSKNINRPQFREIAPFLYYNFEDQTQVRGNPELKQASIANYDIRFEIFPKINEIISFGLFLKEIRNPIEKVFVISTGQNDRSYENASFARNFGLEIEYRTSLEIISQSLDNFLLISNYSRIWSEIEETNRGTGKTFRPMQGQSPYVINLILNYSNTELDLSASISYNRFGKRIFETANFAGDDIYEFPRNLLDLTISKRISSSIELKLTVKDLLAEKFEFYEDDLLIRSFNANTKLSLGVSYQL